MKDKLLMDWFEKQPKWKQSDIVNDNRFASFRVSLQWHFEHSEDFG